MSKSIEVKEAIGIYNEMVKYQENVYISLMNQLNKNYCDILKEDLGAEFVRNCGRDLAGEIVRNCFNTADYNITVDQLVERVFNFSYENEYDPLNRNNGTGEINKIIYNHNEFKSSDLDKINLMLENSQEKLFSENRANDKYDRKGKIEYRKNMNKNKGEITDELTGKNEKAVTFANKNGKVIEKSDLQADHIQSREAAMYNSKYIKESKIEALRIFWNSPDNMQMIHQSANSSKGDIRVCLVEGKIKYVNARSNEYDANTDITYKATSNQLMEAIVEQWEKVDLSRTEQNQPKINKLKEKGYLDEEGKVPPSVKRKLLDNIKKSQNAESITILKNMDYSAVAEDALKLTVSGIGKIIAGQIIYYAAPPFVYELRGIVKQKGITLNSAMKKLQSSAKRIGEYLLSKLKNIFTNIAVNSLKKFIKSFMDILIEVVKGTIKRLLKIVKSLVISTVDAIRIISDRNASNNQKANAVFNLYGVTVTSCVVDLLFELAADSLHIPAPFDDIVFGPLQILATVICTNLTLIILKKADLFDVEFGFKMSQIKTMFEETRENYLFEMEIIGKYSNEIINEIMQNAKDETRQIYYHLKEVDYRKKSVNSDLEKVNSMFSLNIDFEKEWLSFMGI